MTARGAALMGQGKESKTKVDAATLQKIQNEVEKIQFGSVTLVVHEGKVVQIDTNYKIRLESKN
jgi:hypothetical protein